MKKIMIFFLLSTFIAMAQQKTPVPGTVLDSLSVPNSKDTYTVYLPKSYSTDRQWPVIMVFDPSGRGAFAIQRFTEAADRYGYVVVASNGVKNGTYQENLNIARSFYTEVLNRFPINENTIYLAGFSGGSRLAVSIAAISKNIKGVMACGAAFANNETYIPKTNNFFYVGIVGDEDFNYREMQSAQDYLERRKFDPDLLVFSGGHQWPPVAYIDKAVRLLTVKSMTRNILPKNDETIADFFAEEKMFNQQLVAQNQWYRAYNDMGVNERNYRFYVEKDTLRAMEKAIKRNKQYRKQRNEAYQVDEIESNFYLDYMNFLPNDIASGDLESLAYWEEELDLLKKDYLGSPTQAKKKMGKRIISFLTIVPLEMEASYNEKEGLDNLLYINIFKTLVDAKDYDAYLSVLTYTVKKGEYGMALYYLEKMLKNGFKDVKTLDGQEGIALLRIQPEYNELLEAYGLEARY